MRYDVVRKRGWLFYIVVSIFLAISAAYELLEWTVAVSSGTQGDVRDTQKDMATALVGSIVAQLTLARWHDRQIGKVTGSRGRGVGNLVTQ